MAASFGLDFGTTNSVISVIRPDPERPGTQRCDVLTQGGRPHPSVVWYRGGEPVVGQVARDQLDILGLGVFRDIVRSPKMFLGSPTGIYIGGVTHQAVDVVADVLRYLRQDALNRGFQGNRFDSAVITIPVTMDGRARAQLRQAAQKAGIHIHQFIHEPLAALYGYLRSKADFRQELANLERRLVLVFDWGGGTLDLTLCKLQNGVLTQIFNLGDMEVGGDQFDMRLRQLVRQKHESRHPRADWSRIQPSADARLNHECEDAKIALSENDSRTIFVPELLAVQGPEKNVNLEVTKSEFEESVRDLISQGLSKIKEILYMAGVDRGAVELCLATGGMVSMPAIREGLRDIFGMSRLRLAANSATLISEGAAWIAHDDLGLQLAKPIELLHADDSYVEIVPAGTALPHDTKPFQTKISMYCVDPTDGFAKFLFARPSWPGRKSHSYNRVPYTHLTVPVDPRSRPLFERLQVEVTIDHDLIAHICAQSVMLKQSREEWIHDLEFGLSVQGVGNVK